LGMDGKKNARMDEAYISACLGEYGLAHPELSTPSPRSGRRGGDAAETALFVEEVFGLTLGDAEIESGRLETLEGIRALVLERLALTEGFGKRLGCAGSAAT
jgi:hypothetical protein